MSFLSLAKGDPVARDLLQRAIRARYGVRPLSFDSVRLSLAGSGKGPLGVPVRSAVTLTIIPVSHWRWDQSRKMLGMNQGDMTLSFDGGTLYQRSGTTTTQIQTEAAMQGTRHRLWSETALLLTPLTTPEVVVKIVDEGVFRAINRSETGGMAIIRLNADDTVASIEANCYHPTKQALVRLVIKPEGGLQTLEGFSIPKQLVYQWDGEAPERYDVTSAEANPKIPLTEFSLG
ncbi:MAG: hypothetical protein IT324_10490 [Anaerolineae bacterium]|nr:hypothetical protein [Anaerolineae bacterium]